MVIKPLSLTSIANGDSLSLNGGPSVREGYFSTELFLPFPNQARIVKYFIQMKTFAVTYVQKIFATNITTSVQSIFLTPRSNYATAITFGMTLSVPTKPMINGG